MCGQHCELLAGARSARGATRRTSRRRFVDVRWKIYFVQTLGGPQGEGLAGDLASQKLWNKHCEIQNKHA